MIAGDDDRPAGDAWLDLAERAFVDTVAVLFAGRSEPAVTALADPGLAEEAGGPAPGRWGGGRRSGPAGAARRGVAGGGGRGGRGGRRSFGPGAEGPPRGPGRRGGHRGRPPRRPGFPRRRRPARRADGLRGPVRRRRRRWCAAAPGGGR